MSPETVTGISLGSSSSSTIRKLRRSPMLSLCRSSKASMLLKGLVFATLVSPVAALVELSGFPVAAAVRDGRTFALDWAAPEGTEEAALLCALVKGGSCAGVERGSQHET